MKRLRRAARLLLLLSLGGACRCGDDPNVTAALGAADLDLGPMPEDVPPPGAVYKEAYERALKELDANNAQDRLRELEKEIAHDSRSLENYPAP